MLTRIKHKIKEPDIKRRCLVFLVFILIFIQRMDLEAQDIHFSLYYAAPLITNPANTGMSGNGLRIANIYRNQWSKIGIPYETFSTSVDKKLTIAGQSFGLGGFILHDQSSSFNLSANEFMISVSYSRIIRNQQITIGLQPGFVLKSFNLEGMTFSSQFNQASEFFDISLPSLENGMSDRLRYFDLNAGLFWRTMIRNIMPGGGISVSHLNMPLQKFSTSSDGTRLPMRLNANAEVIVPVNARIDLVPCLIYSYTSGTNEFLIGSSGNYSLARSNTPVSKIYALAMIRLNPMRDIDALILGGGAGFLNFNLGLGYDLNISPLSKVTNFNGAFEVSLIYTGRGHDRDNKNQPCYIIN
ncbi:MAG: PorP/SprF family type IX secretion system membrane protein [Bacteroidia bacterium]|nr:PorP/SprF family type IX secretion system membrane protein [Bacteroidia bacterium]